MKFIRKNTKLFEEVQELEKKISLRLDEDSIFARRIYKVC